MMRTFKEWRDGCLSKKYPHLITEGSDYKDGDILRLWYNEFFMSFIFFCP